MKKEEQFLLWFEQLERGDVAIVGGKSSSLGEMTSKTDVPVPYGFATTAYAYRYFIEKSGLHEKMRTILSELTDVENGALLRDVCARLRAAIMAEEMPKDLKKAIPEDGNVYLAMDPDREGEAIAWHVANVLKLENPKRVTFHEITEDAIKEAIILSKK